MVRLRSAGGLTSSTMSLSRGMVTASPARGALPSGQEAGLDHSDRLTADGAAAADAGIFMPAWASWANAWAPPPSMRAAGSSEERTSRRDGMLMASVLIGTAGPAFLMDAANSKKRRS